MPAAPPPASAWSKLARPIARRSYHAVFPVALALALALARDRPALLHLVAPTAVLLLALGATLPRLLGPRAPAVAIALAFGLPLALAPRLGADRHAMARALVAVVLVWLPLLALLHPLALIRRWKELIVLGVTSSLLVLFLHFTGPTLLRRFVLRGYNLDVDHRPKPFFAGTNEDGIRSQWSPKDFKADEYNIIILGDSFTWASAVPREQGFTVLVENELRARYPNKKVRVANFGWISSSPLLQLRQLKQIGAKYKPDLVLQCFDMTDFHDDLTYTEAFHDEGVDNPSGEITIFRAFRGALSLLLGVADYGAWLKQEIAVIPESHYKVDKPNRRFFFLFQPMEDSEPHAELSWQSILQTRDEAAKLGAKYALFIMPRYQQYNRNEAPDDVEKAEFPASDEFILEPFRYFEKKSKEVSFPIHSLLEAFRTSGVFPTCPPQDPHWNAAGNRVAADAITKFLIADRFLE